VWTTRGLCAAAPAKGGSPIAICEYTAATCDPVDERGSHVRRGSEGYVSLALLGLLDKRVQRGSKESELIPLGAPAGEMIRRAVTAWCFIACVAFQ